MANIHVMVSCLCQPQAIWMMHSLPAEQQKPTPQYLASDVMNTVFNKYSLPTICEMTIIIQSVNRAHLPTISHQCTTHRSHRQQMALLICGVGWDEKKKIIFPASLFRHKVKGEFNRTKGHQIVPLIFVENISLFHIWYLLVPFNHMNGSPCSLISSYYPNQMQLQIHKSEPLSYHIWQRALFGSEKRRYKTTQNDGPFVCISVLTCRFPYCKQNQMEWYEQMNGIADKNLCMIVWAHCPPLKAIINSLLFFLACFDVRAFGCIEFAAH